MLYFQKIVKIIHVKVKSYLHIEKQCGNKLWGMNY